MIGVVIPTINCLKYLQRAIDSIAASQVDEPLEFIVIDNASTDGTADYLKARPEIHTLSPGRNLGVAAAWNLGIRESKARGHRIAFVANNDILLAPDALANLLQWHAEGVLFATVHSVAVHPRDLPAMERPVKLGNWLDCCGFTYDFSLLETVGEFDETFWPGWWEDIDYLFRLRKGLIRHGEAMNALTIHFRSRSIHEGGVKLHPYFERNRQWFVRKHGHIPGLT